MGPGRKDKYGFDGWLLYCGLSAVWVLDYGADEVHVEETRRFFPEWSLS